MNDTFKIKWIFDQEMWLIGREGWRRRQEALRLGGPAWLADWTGRAVDEENGKPQTLDQIEEAVDRAVNEVVTAHAAAVRRNSAESPPDADRMSALFHVLLTQCGEPARQDCGAFRRRTTARDRRMTWSYAIRAAGGSVRTGLLFVAVSRANSATAFLRRLNEAASLPQRLFLITDQRMKLRLGLQERLPQGVAAAIRPVV